MVLLSFEMMTAFLCFFKANLDAQIEQGKKVHAFQRS